MVLSLLQLVPPLLEPVTVETAKQHLRVETPDDDLLIEALIAAAREDIELYLRRQLLPATWVLGLETLPSIIVLPRPPALSVLSMEHYDSSGVLVPIVPTTYVVDLMSQPARVALAPGATWPDVQQGLPLSVQLTYVAGYASAAHVPSSIKQAILLLVGDFYEHREARLDIMSGVSRIEDNPTVARLLYKWRVLEV